MIILGVSAFYISIEYLGVVYIKILCISMFFEGNMIKPFLHARVKPMQSL